MEDVCKFKGNDIYCEEKMPDMSFSDGDCDENYMWNIEVDFDY